MALGKKIGDADAECKKQIQTFFVLSDLFRQPYAEVLQGLAPCWRTTFPTPQVHAKTVFDNASARLFKKYYIYIYTYPILNELQHEYQDHLACRKEFKHLVI